MRISVPVLGIALVLVVFRFASVLDNPSPVVVHTPTGDIPSLGLRPKSVRQLGGWVYGEIDPLR